MLISSGTQAPERESLNPSAHKHILGWKVCARKLEVVLADVGNVELASAAGRYVVRNWQRLEIPIVTPNYRAPMCSWAVATLAPI